MIFHFLSWLRVTIETPPLPAVTSLSLPKGMGRTEATLRPAPMSIAWNVAPPSLLAMARPLRTTRTTSPLARFNPPTTVFSVARASGLQLCPPSSERNRFPAKP